MAQQPRANEISKAVNDLDDNEDRQQNRGNLAILHQPEGGEQFEVHTPGDHPDHGRGAEVHFPAIECEVGCLGQDLGITPKTMT